jgi:Tol biopolymer transport system component
VEGVRRRLIVAGLVALSALVVAAAVVQVPLAAQAPRPAAVRIAASSTLTYTSDKAPNLLVADVVRIAIETGRREHVTRTPARDEIGPRWSQDGRAIAFVRLATESNGGVVTDRPDLYVRDARGGEHLVARDAKDPEWSPDGSLLAFAHSAEPNAAHDIFVVRADGRALRRVTPERPDLYAFESNASVPRWSPDGRWIAFQRGYGVSVIGSDGVGERVVQAGLSRGSDWLLLDWSPDGSRLAWAIDYGYPRSPACSIGVAEPFPSAEQRLHKVLDGDCTSLQWSLDGTRVLVSERTGVTAVDVASGASSVLVRGARAGAWSPDGKRLAFVRDWRLWVASADGGSARPVAGRASRNELFDDPRWSPDGRTLLVSARLLSNDLELYARSSSGALRQLTSNDVSERVPLPSPDGTTLAFARGDTAWLLEVESGRTRRLPGTKRFSSFGWSPDSSMLLVERLRNRKPRVLGFAPTGQLLAGFDSMPVWSPDGLHRGMVRKHVLSVDGRRVAAGVDRVAWSPRGSALAFDRDGRLYVAGSDGAGARAIVDRVCRPPATSEFWLAPCVTGFQWEPTGDRLLVTRALGRAADPDYGDWTIRPDGAGLRRFEENHLAWSPDGRLMLVERQRRKSGETYYAVVPTNATRARRPLFPGVYGEPFWSPDGRRIAFRATDDDPFRGATDKREIFVLRIATGRGTTALELDESPAREPALAWGPCTVLGTAGNDSLVGTRARDVICGLGGRDVIRGRGGDDVLYGASGNDILNGGAGLDLLFGGSGSDVLVAKDGEEDGLNGGPGHDRVEDDRADRQGSVP